MSTSNRANRYAPEFRQQMIDLVRGGRQVAELAREFGCTGWTIKRWVKRADQDVGGSDGGSSSNDREELLRLRRENQQLKQERDILSRAAAWFAQDTAPRRYSGS
jgi:transposase